MRRYQLLLTGILGLAVASSVPAQGIDPPTRVGRVSDLLGTVSLYAVGADDWAPASRNYPLTSGDALWADDAARAEVQLGASAVRIAAMTSLVFGEVSDTVTQIRVDEGAIDVHILELNPGQVYEIDTPSGVVSLLDRGRYRIDVTPDGRRTTVTVRDGSAEVSVGDQYFEVRAGTSATLIGADRPPIMAAAIQPDDWERWADERAQREDAVESTQYVSRDMVGYQDLDDYGTWQTDYRYGAVWFPRDVPRGWAPYRNGRWISVEPWGWTWVDDAPWGFAPFHYGRWASVRGRWGWIPGETRRVRPVYAPALVAFVGGSGWGVSISIGGGGVGWVPLAPGEPFVPAYRATPTYVSRLNGNLRGVRPGVNLGRPDVGRIPLANRNVPGAVTAVPRDAFVRSRPVAPAAVPIRPTDIVAVRPSAVPVAAGQPIAPPPHGQPPEPARGGGRAPHPSGLPPGQVAPTPPPEVRARPRPAPGQPPRQEPPAAQPAPAPAPIPPAPAPVQPGRGRGRGQPPAPVNPPQPAPPPVKPPPAQPTPVQLPPVQPPPVQPPPARGQGRGRQPAPPPPPAPQPAPPPAPVKPPPAKPTPVQPPPVQPPPAQPPPVQPPPAQPLPVQPPPARGQGRGRQPALPPPPAPQPAPAPAPVKPPPAQPTPVQPPPVQPPPARGNPPPAPADNVPQQLVMLRKQLVARQQQEDADLAARHQAQLKALPPGTSPAQLQQQQQKEKRALDQRHQQERDQLEKRFRNPN